MYFVIERKLYRLTAPQYRTFQDLFEEGNPETHSEMCEWIENNGHLMSDNCSTFNY